MSLASCRSHEVTLAFPLDASETTKQEHGRNFVQPLLFGPDMQATAISSTSIGYRYRMLTAVAHGAEMRPHILSNRNAAGPFRPHSLMISICSLVMTRILGPYRSKATDGPLRCPSALVDPFY